MKKRSSMACLTAIVVFCLGLSTCRRHVSLVIQEGNPLRFVVAGPGTMTNLQISGPDLAREPNPQGDGDRLMLLKPYWELASTRAIALDDIGSITYGKVPDGFVQIEPQNGAAPPALVEHNRYNIRFVLDDGGGINRFFTIKDGKVVAEGER